MRASPASDERAATNRVSSLPGGFRPGYDPNGKLTSDSVHMYTWDAEGRVTQVAVNGISTFNFTYNALGQLVEKNKNSGTYTEYVYDAAGDVVMTSNRTTTLEDLIPLGGRMLAKYQSSKAYFIHPNPLGSSITVTDYASAVQQDLPYYPFGGRAALVSTNIIDERFASLPERDQDSTLDFAPFRNYNPTMMRWLSPDLLAGSILNPQSLNRYAYVLNNPTNFIDPLGLCPQPPRPDLQYTPDCKHLHERPCTNMNCADQYYGGLLFYGANDANLAICMKGGVLGYCGGDFFDSYTAPNGGDIFDAIGCDPSNAAGCGGVWWIPPGPSVDSSGRASTSTGGIGFSDLLWSEVTGTSDVLEGPQTGRDLPKLEQEFKDALMGNFVFMLNRGSAASRSPGFTAFAPVDTLVTIPNVKPYTVTQWIPLPGFSGP